MNEQIYEIKQKLNHVDLEFLKNVYLFRCLTIRQAYNSFYQDSIPYFNKFIDIKLRELVKNDLIEEVLFNKNNIALFLTKKGVEIVKDAFKLPNEILDIKTKKIVKGYYTSSQLKMLPRLIPHQIHLNQFVLDFKKIYNHKNYSSNWTYFDEKYVSQYSTIRPDGLINFLGTDFFLEMDMATENKAQLIDKWKNYRRFLNSGDYLIGKKKIIVLFILGNTNNIENRKNIVKLTASSILLDEFSDYFDIIVGTKDELLTRLFNVIIPNIQQTNYRIEELKGIINSKHGFSVASAHSLKKQLNNTDYEFYIRKLDEQNSIILDEGVLQEYLMDYFYIDNLNIINRISYMAKNNATFKHYYKRDLKYIVVVDNLQELYKELSLFELYLEPNIYYTTIDRLNALPFHKALVQFDSLGQIYSFIDKKMNTRLYEN